MALSAIPFWLPPPPMESPSLVCTPRKRRHPEGSNTSVVLIPSTSRERQSGADHSRSTLFKSALRKAKTTQQRRPKVCEIQAAPERRSKREDRLSLPCSVVQDMLRHTKPYRVDPQLVSARGQHIPYNLYTGGFEKFVERLAELGPGQSDTLFLTPDRHPSMPKGYGEHGLLAGVAGMVIGHQGRRSVFRWGTHARTWAYLGEYEFRVVGCMTPSQFSSQREEAKETWARDVLTGEELNYMARRAWLALKLAGQFPDVESGAEDAILKELWRMVEDRGYPVSEDDVLDAYTSGKEKVEIIRMDCVGFDPGSMKRVYGEFRRWKSEGVLPKKPGVTLRPTWITPILQLEATRSVASGSESCPQPPSMNNTSASVAPSTLPGISSSSPPKLGPIVTGLSDDSMREAAQQDIRQGGLEEQAPVGGVASSSEWGVHLSSLARIAGPSSTRGPPNEALPASPVPPPSPALPESAKDRSERLHSLWAIDLTASLEPRRYVLWDSDDESGVDSDC